MRKITGFIHALVFLASTNPGWCTENGVPDTTAPAYTRLQLAEHIYELSVDGGGYPVKVIASIGHDGLLLVDTGEEEVAPALVDALKGIGGGKPAIIINTHSHIEHLGGNAIFGRGPTIVGHTNLRRRYLHGLYGFGKFPQEALPFVTFTDTMSIHFNGEEIRLAAFPGAHDDSDILVWFTMSKVAVVGALCMGHHFPSIDVDTGDILRYHEVCEKALAMLPEDVRLIPGHAEDCTMAQARLFLDMTKKTGEIVRKGLAEGKDAAGLESEDVLAAFKSFESSYVKRGTWIRYWASALLREPGDRHERPRPYAPLLAAYRKGGAAAAVSAYRDLRSKRRDDFRFEEKTLFWIGRRMHLAGDQDGASRVLELEISEFPESETAFQAHGLLGKILTNAGNRDQAREHFRLYLQKFPNDEDIAKMLSSLEN